MVMGKISFTSFASDALPDEWTFEREVKKLMEAENLTEQEAASRLYRKYSVKKPDEKTGKDAVYGEWDDASIARAKRAAADMVAAGREVQSLIANAEKELKAGNFGRGGQMMMQAWSKMENVAERVG